MVLKRTKNEVRAALASNIMETCRQVLPDIEEIFVEGLLGVTLNKREIFLVNLSDLYSREEATSPPKKKRGRRSIASSEFRKDYNLDESFDCEDVSSKRLSGSWPIALLVESGEQDKTATEDITTHYIKEEEMVFPEDYGIPKVGRPPKQNFPELEEVAVKSQPQKSTLPPCVRLPKVENIESTEQDDSEPVLDLSIDKRHSLSRPDMSNLVNLLTSSPAETAHNPNSNENTKSRRKRGRPCKISDDSIRCANYQAICPVLEGGSFNVNPAEDRNVCQPSNQPSNQPFSSLNMENLPLNSGSDQPQDFSMTSLKQQSSDAVLDLNMNSAFNLKSQNTPYSSQLPAESPVPYFSNSSYSNNQNSSILAQDSIDQSESFQSNSNGQSEVFSQINQETNQSDDSVRSPGQSENSFQSGPIFPHLEEYDGVPFNSSMEDHSFNDSNLEASSANESMQEEDSDRIELTSTGRPKRKTSMSPWVRQFFNITTGGGESKTVQIKATQTCPICQKVFSAGSHLKRHYLVTHTNSSKFQCRICTKRFGSADHLKRHMGTHALEKKFKCHLCNRCFNVKYRLTEHLAEKHNLREISKELQIILDNSQNEAVAVATNDGEVSMGVAMETDDSIDHVDYGNSSIAEPGVPT